MGITVVKENSGLRIDLQRRESFESYSWRVCVCVTISCMLVHLSVSTFLGLSCKLRLIHPSTHPCPRAGNFPARKLKDGVSLPRLCYSRRCKWVMEGRAGWMPLQTYLSADPDGELEGKTVTRCNHASKRHHCSGWTAQSKLEKATSCIGDLPNDPSRMPCCGCVAFEWMRRRRKCVGLIPLGCVPPPCCRHVGLSSIGPCSGNILLTFGDSCPFHLQTKTNG